jgi:hypothetical protein
MRLGQNDCLQGEKEIRKEISHLSYLHNIHKVTLFVKTMTGVVALMAEISHHT